MVGEKGKREILGLKRLFFDFNAAKGAGLGWQKYLWVAHCSG